MSVNNGGPVIYMSIPSASLPLPHYSGSSRVSPRSPTPLSPSIKEQLIERVNLLRDMHLVLFYKISERRYRAEREINLSQQENKISPPSPSKAQIQDPLQQFYLDKVHKLQNIPNKLDSSHMGLIALMNRDIENKILETETTFVSEKSVRQKGLEARIRNEQETAMVTFETADLAKFEKETPEEIDTLREMVQGVREFVGRVYSRPS